MLKPGDYVSLRGTRNILYCVTRPIQQYSDTKAHHDWIIVPSSEEDDLYEVQYVDTFYDANQLRLEWGFAYATAYTIDINVLTITEEKNAGNGYRF